MINYRNLGAHSPDMNIDTFKLFARLIEKGDHICKPIICCCWLLSLSLVT